MKRYNFFSIMMMILLSLSGGCASPTSQATPVPTQPDAQTRVLIDGQGDDWQAYPAIGMDEQGDQRIGTPDLGEVRAFSNDRYFYLFIRLYAQGATDHYDIVMDVDGGESDFQISVWPEQNRAVFSVFPVTGDMQPLAGVSAAQDDVIEVKMPLSAVGNLPVRSIFIQTWMSGETGDMVEGLSVALVEETDPAMAAASNPTAIALPIPTAALTSPAPASERPGHVQVTGLTEPAGYAYRAFMQIPVGMVWGPDDMLYVADWTGRHVVRVAKDGTMDDLPFWKTVKGLQGDGPRGIAFDSKGNLYVNNHSSIFRIELNGNVTELSGVEGRPIGSIAISPTDELYYTDRASEGGALRRWQDGGSVTIAGNLPFAENMVFGLDGTLYLTPMAQGQVLKVDVNTGAVSTFKEDVCGNDPCFLAVDKEGDIWVRGIARLSQFTPEGVKKTFVVDGKKYPGGPYYWRTPAGIAFDDEGGLWIASYGSQLIRLSPTAPGQPDPEFTMQVIYPGFENADLEVGLNGEIYASEDYVGQILRINPDGGVDVVLDHGFQGHAALAIDSSGIVYAGLPNREIVRIQADGTATHYAQLLTSRMAFGADGALYAVAVEGGFGQNNAVVSIVRITNVDTFTVLTTEIDGIALGKGEAHISPALDDGFYIYIEQTCDLLFMDFSGQGHLIANTSSLGCGGPAVMAASPLTGDIYLISHGPYKLYRFTPDGQYTLIAERIFGDPLGMVVSRDGQWLYVAENGAIDKIPISNNLP